MKRLLRSKTEKMLGGVAGGMAEYLDVDPSIMRLIFIVVTLAGGAGILAYIILWIVLPEDGSASYAQKVQSASREKDEKVKEEKFKATAEEAKSELKNAVNKGKSDDGRIVFASILIVLGLIFLAGNFISLFNIFKLWPLTIIVIGLALLINSAERD